MQQKNQSLDELNEAFAVESKEYASLKEHFDKIDADIGRNDEVRVYMY
jgi:hypothetical protein